MSAERNTIDGILYNATGKRASGREYLVTPKQAILTPEAATTLKEQWNSAGRDNCLVVMRLAEADGSSPHYVTGWDGHETFVCMTETGLVYTSYHKLTKLEQDAEWNPETRLIEVRQPLLRETMERSDVDMLLDRVKKCLTKSSKKRRKSRLRNMEKFFGEDSCSAGKAPKKAPGPESETEFEEIKEKDERAPTAKLPKSESGWDLVDKDGSIRRRTLNHPMMKVEDGDLELDKRELVDVDKESGGGVGPTPGGNKCDPQMKLRQLVRMNKDTGAFTECGDPQLSLRQHVRMDKEGKGGSTGATPGGNKTDPQLDDREQIDVRNEEKSAGCSKCGYTDYAGQHGKCPECGARPDIVVRHEGLDLDDKSKDLFSKKKSPEKSAKKLFMFSLIMGKKGKKGEKGKKDADKAPMSENTLVRSRLSLVRDSGQPPRLTNLEAIRNRVGR
jgi:hypothetical protein